MAAITIHRPSVISGKSTLSATSRDSDALKVSASVDKFFSLLKESETAYLAKSIDQVALAPATLATSIDKASVNGEFMLLHVSPSEGDLLAAFDYSTRNFESTSVKRIVFDVEAEEFDPSCPADGLSASRIIQSIAERIFCCPHKIWDLFGMHQFISANYGNSISHLLVYFVNAHRLEGQTVKRLAELLPFICGAECRVVLVMDGLESVHLGVPLMRQVEMSITSLKGRPPRESHLDLLSWIILEHEAIPSASMLEFLKRRSMHNRAALLKIALVEFHAKKNIEAHSQIALLSLPSTMTRINDFKIAFHSDGTLLEDDSNVILLKESFSTTQTALKAFVRAWKVFLCLWQSFSPLCKSPNKLATMDSILFSENIISIPPRALSHLLAVKSEDFTGCLTSFQRLFPEKEFMAIKTLDDFQSHLSGTFSSGCNEFALKTLPLFELFQLDVTPSLNKLINPRILESIQLALTSPSFYQPNPSQFTKDAAMLYRLLEECGKLVNQMDWYQSFRSSLPANPSTSSSSKRNATDERDNTLRFQRASLELQLMGFIGPTKKRPEHFERLLVFSHTNQVPLEDE